MHKLKSKYITLEPVDRLHKVEKPLIGLTGGIATGKSTASKHLVSKGIPLIDADALIHQIYEEKETHEFVRSIAPEAIKSGTIDFKILRKLFFSQMELKSQLENFLYKKLPEAFTNKAREFEDSEWNFIIYDVPLLFEKDLKPKLDQTILIYCPPYIQLERLIKRDKISQEEAEKILAHQMDINAKRSKSNFVVDNSNDIGHLKLGLDHLIGQLI